MTSPYCSRVQRGLLASAFAALLLAGLSATDARAQGAPDSLSFQGFLTKPNGTPLDSTVSITFKLYKGATAVWTETQPSVTVTDGVLDVLLGGVTPLDSVAFNQPIDLGIKVGGDAEIVPRTPLAGTAFSLGMRGMYAVWKEDPSSNKSFNVLGGGSNNSVSALVVGATISGGGGLRLGVSHPNTVTGDFGTVGGGTGNSAAEHSTVGGGLFNTASGTQATVGGGGTNTASGLRSTVPGGLSNRAMGSYSFAAGRRAKADHDGAFAWADDTDADFASTAADQFLIRAGGGIGIGTNAPDREATIFDRDSNGDSFINMKVTSGSARELLVGVNQTAGGIIATQTNHNLQLRTNATARITIEAGGEVGIGTDAPSNPLEMASGAHVTVGGVWTDASSRALKQDFQAVDRREILESVANLPVTRWRYRNEDGVAHMGPVAEDFHATFGLGADDKHLAALDGNGVAFAAIQGLYEIVKRQQAEIDALKKPGRSTWLAPEER